MNEEIKQQIAKLQIWDNGGKTFDRYAVVWPNGSNITMNRQPLHPLGAFLHGSGATYNPMVIERDGARWSYLGKQISFEELPEDCQKAILLYLGAEL